MKNFNITNVYREEVPNPEDAVASATPAPVIPPETPEVTPDEGQDTIPEDANLWNDLSNDIEEPDDLPEDSPEDEGLVEPEPEVPTPEAPAVPEPEPEAEIPAEVEPTAADTAVPTEPEVQPTPEEPEPAPIPQPTAEEQAASRAARTTELETNLTTRFGITDAEALQLVTDPGKAFPKLQARMFTDMWLAVEQLIDTRLPSVIENTTRNMKVRDEKVDDFFVAWPKLDRKKHGQQVAEVARVYSQVKSNATEAEVIQHVGMQVMMMNGIVPDDVVVQGTPAVEDPSQVPAPHRPAAVNGARAPQQSSDNLYTAMSIELEDDED